MKRFKVFLGDSVYAEINPAGQLWLTTENGYPDDPRNQICLEPEVYQALVQFVETDLARQKNVFRPAE